MARTWGDGCGLPCNYKAKENQLCGIHGRNNKYGLITDEPPTDVEWSPDAVHMDNYDTISKLSIPVNKDDELISFTENSENTEEESSFETVHDTTQNSSTSSSFDLQNYYKQINNLNQSDNSTNDTSSTEKTDSKSTNSIPEAELFYYEGMEYYLVTNDEYDMKDVYKQTSSGDPDGDYELIGHLDTETGNVYFIDTFIYLDTEYFTIKNNDTDKGTNKFNKLVFKETNNDDKKYDWVGILYNKKVLFKKEIIYDNNKYFTVFNENKNKTYVYEVTENMPYDNIKWVGNLDETGDIDNSATETFSLPQ